MLLFPSELDSTNLASDARRLITTMKNRIQPNNYIGVAGVNLSGTKGDDYFAILSPYGLLMLRFFTEEQPINDASLSILRTVHRFAGLDALARLKTHSVLKNTAGNLCFPVRVLYIFPSCKEAPVLSDTNNIEFWNAYCKTATWTTEIRRASEDTIRSSLATYNESQVDYTLPLQDKMINVILNRIAPWCTIPKLAGNDGKKDENASTATTLNSELSINDSMVEVLRLEQSQIDIVNNLKNGHQLMLACAGSGKSVLLIAKCIKIASQDKKRKCLILCYNQNLRDYYRWQIDEAGFRERNVECYSYFQLCYSLLTKYRVPIPVRTHNMTDDQFYQTMSQRTIDAINQGIITERYYGIFIDEVQVFEPSWYRMCYSLLEDPQGENHMWVICGDITQDVRKNMRNSRAPWQGEGLPSFTNRTLHIEKNYRNSKPINDFINLYAANVRKHIPESFKMSMDTYLRGTAFRDGPPPRLELFSERQVKAEATVIVEAVQRMHDKQNIAFTDIAVLLYNQSGHVPGYRSYRILSAVHYGLAMKDIPCVRLAWSDNRVQYATRDGVALISYQGALGLDFRGIVVAGIPAIGARLGVASETKETIVDVSSELQGEYQLGFDALYIACTRAKDSLTIVMPSPSIYSSTYTQIILDSMQEYQQSIDH